MQSFMNFPTKLLGSDLDNNPKFLHNSGGGVKSSKAKNRQIVETKTDK